MPGAPRVLVLTPDFPPAHGGIQLVMDRLVRNWERIRPRVVTLAAAGAGAKTMGRSMLSGSVRRPG